MLRTAKSEHFSHYLLWVFLMVGLTVSASVAAEPAGRLLFTRGDVQILRSGNGAVPAGRGDSVEVGDSVKTGANSNAQLRLSDGAMIALRANTLFQVERQDYDPKAPGEGSQASKLIRGGMRAITGAIGKEKPSAVEYRTPVATIGIRGTVIDVIYVPEGGLPGLPDVAPGNYTLVLKGQVSVANPAGELQLNVGEIAYSADDDTPPELRPDLSWVFEAYHAMYGDSESEEVSAQDAGEDDGEETGTEENETTGDETLTGEVGSVLTDTAATTTTSKTKDGPYAMAITASGFTVYEAAFTTDVVTLNSSGELVYADAGTDGLIEVFDATSGSALNTGSTTAGTSTINWGQYDYLSVTLTDDANNTLSTSSNVQYINATEMLANLSDLPTTGSFTYNYVGGAGVTLDSTSSLVVDFGAETMSVNLDWSSAGYNWTASNKNISDFYANGISLSSGIGPGSISGRFVGENAEGAMTSFELNVSDYVASGVAAFKR